jgi:hypothetical protein
MTKLQAIRSFMNYVLREQIVIAKDRLESGNFAMDIINSVPRVILPQDLNATHDECDKAFRKDFIQRCPLARGFSSITLTLLHECGHWETRSNMDIIEYSKMKYNVYTQEQYMKIPWEHLATEWAICWLYSPMNRKVAKAFEKNYFGYGKE